MLPQGCSPKNKAKFYDLVRMTRDGETTVENAEDTKEGQKEKDGAMRAK